MAFYEQGRKESGFERGIELALRAMLVSPKFVFRTEQDPPTRFALRRDAAASNAAASSNVVVGQPYRVSDSELASRLSFFLWSSIPDDELLDVAASGRLRQPAVLERQVRRMLADPRSRALVGNFAAQWLQFRNLRSTTPDKNLFPDFDDNLRQSFERELELFVGSIVNENRSVLDLLTADYTFVNERLARHYAIPNVYGSRFRRVTVTEDARKGLLGKGGILLVTSHADRTSPVVRGKWILENLIGTPPSPPPAEVPAFPGGRPAGAADRARAHGASPRKPRVCRLSPRDGPARPGAGELRRGRQVADAGGRRPIDASGELGDGTRVDGVVALRNGAAGPPRGGGGHLHRKAHDLRAGPRAGVLRHAGRP